MTSTDPLIGQKLGDYSIVDILGEGGMARVYRGFDAKLERYAAVKVINAHLIAGNDQEEYRQRFQNEARAIARLRHSNIVGIYQFGEVGTLYYMAMASIDGHDLRWHLHEHAKTNTFMSNLEMLRVMRDMASALDYAHREGVIHRDVKPSNIMVTPGGHAVLTDFGLALNVPEGTIGNTFGSAHYIAPEQAVSSAQAVAQSDLYSLGIVLFEMLTGRVPFNDPSAMTVAMQHLNNPPPPPSQFNPLVPTKVDEIVLKMLAKEVKQRYVTCDEAVDALEDALGLSVPAADFSETSSKRPNRDLPGKATLRTRSPEDTASDSVWDKGERTPHTHPYNLDDAPTITDSKASKPLRAEITSSMAQANENRKPNRLVMILGGVILALLVTIVVLVAVTSNPANSEVTLTPDADGTAAAALITEEAEPTTEAAPTEAPTDTPTVAAPTDTDTPTEVVAGQATEESTQEATVEVVEEASSTPAPTDTDTPTLTPTSSVADAPVLLVYDADSFTLLNQSDETVNVSNITFVQTKADGTTLTFETRRWEGGTRPTRSLPAGDCFQVWTSENGFLEVPENCADRHSWQQVTFPRWFWISGEDGADNFEVRREEDVLAVCSINAGQCAVPLEAAS